MGETVSVAVALVVVAGAVGGIPLAVFAGGTTGEPADGQVTANGTTTMEPGERLSGVVGVERASVKGEMASRTFGQQVAAVSSNDSRAAVVGDEIARLERRLTELRDQRTELKTAYENGSLSQGEYRARTARLHAEQRALQRRANQTERVAGALPADRLRANGVNVTALETVRTGASSLTGPEVAAAARQISGPNTGGGFGPGGAGPPDFVQNRTGASPGSPGNDPGPPDDAGGDGGPSDDAGGDGGPSDDAGGDGGPPDDAGGDGGPSDDSGNDTGSPDEAGDDDTGR